MQFATTCASSSTRVTCRKRNATPRLGDHEVLLPRLLASYPFQPLDAPFPFEEDVYCCSCGAFAYESRLVLAAQARVRVSERYACLSSAPRLRSRIRNLSSAQTLGSPLHSPPRFQQLNTCLHPRRRPRARAHAILPPHVSLSLSSIASAPFPSSLLPSFFCLGAP